MIPFSQHIRAGPQIYNVIPIKLFSRRCNFVEALARYTREAEVQLGATPVMHHEDELAFRALNFRWLKSAARRSYYLAFYHARSLLWGGMGTPAKR